MDKGLVEPPPEDLRDAVDAPPLSIFTCRLTLSTISLELSYDVYRMQLRGSPGGGGSGSKLESSQFPSNIVFTWDANVMWDWASFDNAARITTNLTASCSLDASQAKQIHRLV